MDLERLKGYGVLFIPSDTQRATALTENKTPLGAENTQNTHTNQTVCYPGALRADSFTL